MDIYNQLLLQQLAPFVKVNYSECLADITSQLRSNFDKYNISNSAWDNSILKNRLLATNYIIEFTESWDIAVPLKQPLPDGEEDRTSEVHSIFSPFNPSSDIYPNGIISENWFKKYICDLPCSYIAVFPLAGLDDTQLIHNLIDLKARYLAYGIKLVCILISNSQNPNDDTERVDNIRQQTGLPRLHGLLYVHGNASANVNLARDLNVLVTSLLSNLKHHSFEFYQHIEAKIKQRNKKYYSYPSASSVRTKIELTPTFLETRNLIKQGILVQFSSPHNVELSLKYLIPAYDNLIDLVRESFQRPEEDFEEHDVKLYTHFRLLLDTIAFHIVRSYLASEDPISALRKHKTHIASVIEAVHLSSYSSYHGSAMNNWISVQYEWLAQLLEIIPQSIRVEPNPKKYGNSTTFYFGGVQFIDNGLKYDITTKPGLLYLKAAEYLGKVKVTKPDGKKSEVRYTLLPDYEESYSKQKKKLALWNKAKSCFVDLPSTSVDYKNDRSSFNSFIKYVNWMIAEEYLVLKDYKSAIESFKISNDGKNPLILQRILECIQQESGKDKEALETAIQISAIRFPLILDISGLHLAKKVDLSNIDRIDETLFKVTPLIFNQNESGKTFLYDECVFQLELSPIFDFQKLAELLNVNDIEIRINKILVTFNTGGGFKNTLIIRDDSIPSTALQTVSLDETYTGSFNVEFLNSSEPKVFEFSQAGDKIGRSQIKSIEIESTLVLNQGNSILHTEEVEYEDYKAPDEADTKNLFHDIKYYVNSTNSESLLDYKYKNVRLNGESMYSVNIVPVKPAVKLEIKDSIDSIIMGEKVKLNILLDVEKRKGVDYNALSIVSDIKLSEAESDNYTIRTSWNNLKDDEPLRLREDQDLEKTLLNLSIQSPPSMVLKEGVKLMLNFKLVFDSNKEITEGNLDIPTSFDISSFEFDLVKEPFELKYGIVPRYRNEKGTDNDMPNPFIVQEGSPISMPVATRAWAGNVTLINKPSSSIDIISANIIIKSMNAEVQLESLGLTGAAQVRGKSDHQIFTRSFTTASKTGYTHRNVVVSTVGTIFWKRKNSDLINEFKSSYWEVTLPLADPRVLLMVQKEEQLSEDLYKLHYVIENPTPRIFTFSSQLVLDQDSSWELVDEMNLVPIAQSPFPVLPFLRHAIDYYSKYRGDSSEGDESLIKLPLMKVFDINYKVGLPTLSVSEDVTAVEGLLYWKK